MNRIFERLKTVHNAMSLPSIGEILKVVRKRRIVRSKRKQDSEGTFLAKVKENLHIITLAILIVATLSFLHTLYVHHVEAENFNFEEAVDKYKGILKLDSSKEIPDEYTRIGMEDKEANLENAILAYREALKIYTVENHPIDLDYARIQNGIGVAYSDLAEVRDKKANLENAILAHKEALKIYTFESYPIEYKWTQFEIGAAYFGLSIAEEEEANLRKAIR